MSKIIKLGQDETYGRVLALPGKKRQFHRNKLFYGKYRYSFRFLFLDTHSLFHSQHFATSIKYAVLNSTKLKGAKLEERVNYHLWQREEIKNSLSNKADHNRIICTQREFSVATNNIGIIDRMIAAGVALSPKQAISMISSICPDGVIRLEGSPFSYRAYFKAGQYPADALTALMDYAEKDEISVSYAVTQSAKRAKKVPNTLIYIGSFVDFNNYRSLSFLALLGFQTSKVLEITQS